MAGQVKPIRDAGAYFLQAAASNKMWRQRRRRREQVTAARLSWRCLVCGDVITAFAKNLKRKTCSMECHRKHRSDVQQERRQRATVECALARMQAEGT